MRKTKKKIEYYGGRMKPLIEGVARMVAKDPSLALPENYEILHARIARAGETNETAAGYGKRDECFNCHRSMRINVYTAGIGHALLLVAMAKVVREEMRKGLDFNHANRVHIDRLPISTSIKKQQSQAGYLGLIKPIASGKRSGYWLITAWGWKALRGESIPKAVKYWDRKLVERSQETTTFGEMMQTHTDKIRKQLALGKKVKTMDHRSEIADYDPIEWAEYAGAVESNTIFNGHSQPIAPPMS